MTITSAQMRAARALLDWSQSDLSLKTDISTTSLGSIENGQSQPRESTVNTIRKVLEDGGVEFLGQDGVRVRTPSVRTFTGRQGFLDFYEDIYNTLIQSPSVVYVNNADEKFFLKWAGNIFNDHAERMKSMEGVSYRILVREGDENFIASDYAQYRWIPRDQFSSVPFYLYGHKLAIIIFSDEPTVVLIEYPAVSNAYRLQFEALWEIAHIPCSD